MASPRIAHLFFREQAASCYPSDKIHDDIRSGGGEGGASSKITVTILTFLVEIIGRFKNSTRNRKDKIVIFAASSAKPTAVFYEIDFNPYPILCRTSVAGCRLRW